MNPKHTVVDVWLIFQAIMLSFYGFMAFGDIIFSEYVSNRNGN